MKFLSLLSYFISVVITYILLSSAEYLTVGFLIDTFNQSFGLKFMVMGVLLIIVNPVMTYLITHKVGYINDKDNDGDINLK